MADLYNETSAFALDFGAGGAVRYMDDASRLTSVTPAFRRAAARIEMFSSWPVTATPAQVRAAFRRSEAWTARLRQAMPDSGTYFSEANYHEPGWQAAFWGAANYARLQAVKAAYDPRWLFYCHQCVELPSPPPRRG